MKIYELIESTGAFTAASKVKCPLCGAESNKSCVGKQGTKNAGKVLNTCHNERLRAAGFGSAKNT